LKNRLAGKKKEYFMTVLLDTRAQFIKICETSVGSLDTSIVHPREVFNMA
jgi:DNA repair protein RadC